MYYLKLKHENTIIEFANDWLGVERIYANGVLMSQKSSVWGTTHPFQLMEDGHMARYQLTVRMDMSGKVLVDLFRDNVVLYHGAVAKMGSRPLNPVNKSKKLGIMQLREYDLDQAKELLLKAAEEDPRDPEIFFHLACTYSLLEKVDEGYNALEKAVQLGLPDTEAICTHEKLAYLRIQDEFESFFENGYKRG